MNQQSQQKVRLRSQLTSGGPLAWCQARAWFGMCSLTGESLCAPKSRLLRTSRAWSNYPRESGCRLKRWGLDDRWICGHQCAGVPTYPGRCDASTSCWKTHCKAHEKRRVTCRPLKHPPMSSAFHSCTMVLIPAETPQSKTEDGQSEKFPINCHLWSDP